jgi:chaperone modulatory protein CbpM
MAMSNHPLQDNIFTGVLIDDAALTLDELARAIAVEREWIVAHVQEGLLDCVVSVELRRDSAAAGWRFTSRELARARRLAAIEHDFDANPELAALLADLEEELATLRKRLAH